MAERIVAAAIRHYGVVLTGPHHHQIMRYARHLPDVIPGVPEQGFVTDRNRFVTRAEAARIAFEVGQISGRQSVLFSEQLWQVPDNVFLGEPTTSTEKALPLPLGHEFLPSCLEETGDSCVVMACGRPAAEHQAGEKEEK